MKKALWITGITTASLILLVVAFRSGIKYQHVLERIGCGKLLSDEVELNVPTAAGNRARFIAMGDTGMGDDAQARVARTAQQVCREKGCDFVLLLGDNFYPDGVTGLDDPKFDSHFEAQYGPINKPVYAVLGNHDVKSGGLPQVMYSLNSPTWRMPNFRYRFKAGPARFLARNTNCSLLDWWDLADHFESDAAGKTGGENSSDWIFVMGHHSIYSTGSHGDTDGITRWYWEDNLAENVDFYLSGHNHLLEHLTMPGQRTQHITSGAGAIWYAQNQSPNPRHTEAESQFAYHNGGLVWFDVTAEAVEVRFFSADAGDETDGGGAKEIHAFTKSKP